jgi:hypothetical protein
MWGQMVLAWAPMSAVWVSALAWESLTTIAYVMADGIGGTIIIIAAAGSRGTQARTPGRKAFWAHVEVLQPKKYPASLNVEMSQLSFFRSL